MSLHINLLKPEERSDPSGKILRTTSIAALAAIGAGLVMYVAYAFLMLQAAQTQLTKAEHRSDDLKQNHKVALGLISEITKANGILAEITAFSNAQVNVSQRLFAIAESVPPEIQISKLSIGTSLEAAGAKKDIPARVYKGEIKGRTAMNGIDDRIRTLIAAMNDAEGLLGTVSPGGNSVDPSKSNEGIFEVNFVLEPRFYKQAQSEAKTK